MTDRSIVLHASETAYDFAKENIDLSGCYYGQPHWEGPFVDRPSGYYYFLAGFVAQLRCSRIFEIGAHFGGSIFSMARGVEYSGLAQSAEIVTVDPVDRNTDAFRANQLVKRILGNSLDVDVTQRVLLSFTGRVDLMFIDAIHTYEVTNGFLEHYLPIVSPRLVVLDDTRLNPSMERLWSDLSKVYGERAIDVTDCSHRGKNAGFGLLICDSL
jgi:cephalosporin hydroxylase